MRTRHRWIGIVAVTGLVLGACGGDDEDSAAETATATDTGESSAPAATAAATTAAPATTEAAPGTTAAQTAESTAPPTTAGPAADKSPLLIALTADFSGPSPVGPRVPEALQAWADHTNAKGGINGHPVEFDIRDTKGDAALAQTLTQELLALDPILFVLHAPSTETSQSELLAQWGGPVMGPGYNPAVWGGYIAPFQLACSTDPGAPISCGIPNAFAVTTTFGAVVDEQVYGAAAAGATKLAVAACAEVDSCGSAVPVFEATAASLGLATAGTTKVSSTASDYSSECIQWIQDGVDFIQISGSSALGVNLIASCSDQGYEGIWGASAGSVRGELIQNDEITMAGGLNAFPWWVDDPLVQEYRDVMAAGGLTEEDWADPSLTGLWSILELFAKAQADLSDDPTSAEALENMYTIQDETLGGLISPVSYSPDNPDRARRCFWPYILEDGVFTNPLGGLNYQCSPAES